MQKGQTALWMVVGVLIIAVIAGGAYYLGRQASLKPSPAPVVTSQTPQSTPSPTPDETVYTESDRSANWKTYTHKEFIFKHPSSWYPEDNPNYPQGNNIGFFMVGAKADHGYGDHQGNEVFAFEVSNDEHPLDEIKKNYYPTATELTIASKSALRTSFDLFIIKISATKKLNMVGGTEEGKKYIDQILSTFQFTK